MRSRQGLPRLARPIAVVCFIVVAALAVIAARRSNPPRAPASALTCSTTVSSAAAAEARVRTAPGGRVICLSSGTYAGLALIRHRAGTVTLQPVPGRRVTIAVGAIDTHRQRVAVVFAPGARHIVLHGFYITDEVELQPGDDSIRIDHNDISQGWFGIQLDSSDCTTPNSPTWPGCHPLPKITSTVISGNRIHDIVGKGDALNVDNFDGLRITHNEIYNLIEGGHHTDCLQSTFGGSNLVFDHNYEHDNECQGFFLKDGDITGARLYDNLFVRDNVRAINGGSSYSTSQVYNTSGLVAERNTIWDTKGLTLRCVGARVPCTATIDHNLFSSLTIGNSGDMTVYKVQESNNIFGERPWSFHGARSDRVRRSVFVNPAKNDYRLGFDSKGIGIDWAPATQHYGP